MIEKNSVVPSTPPKAVQINGIAHRSVTSLKHITHPMAELVCHRPWRNPTAVYLAWLGRDDLLQVPWCNRQSCHRFSIQTSDDEKSLLCVFPAAVYLRRVENIHVKCLDRCAPTSVSVILLGGKDPCHISTSHQPLSWLILSKV